MTLVRERTIPAERPHLVAEVSANFSGYRGVVWSARLIPKAVISGFYTEAATLSFK
jgi:hypothetical protein